MYYRELLVAPDRHWHKRIWKVTIPPDKDRNHQKTQYKKDKDVWGLPALGGHLGQYLTGYG